VATARDAGDGLAVGRQVFRNDGHSLWVRRALTYYYSLLLKQAQL